MNNQTIDELYNLIKYNNISLFDAVTMYCENHDIEPSEMVSKLDDDMISQLKRDASNQFHIIKKINKQKHKMSF